MAFAGCEHYLRPFHNNMKTNARALPKLTCISFPRVLDDMYIVGILYMLQGCNDAFCINFKNKCFTFSCSRYLAVRHFPQ